MTSSTLRIAWRSLWRNPRRTGLALAAIGLSVALVLAYDSILRGYGDWMLETMTAPMLGHVQVHADGWQKDRAMDRTLPGSAALVSAIQREPEVASVAARVYAPALAALAEEGFAVVVVGLVRPRKGIGQREEAAERVRADESHVNASKGVGQRPRQPKAPGRWNEFCVPTLG